ncbi:MAG: lysine biosynthesis protein LysW [Promethearchaeota archaeon]
MSKNCECPSCFFAWSNDDAELMAGEVVTCPDCGADLEVVEITEDALKLEKLDAADEDWGE